MSSATPHFYDSDESEPEEISKSQLKREMVELQKLGAEMVEMTENQLAKLDIPDELRAALAECKRLKQREAKRRFLQFIGKMMRRLDLQPLYVSMQQVEQNAQLHLQLLQRLEILRDRIGSGDNGAIDEVLQEWPRAERQQLRNLQRQISRQPEGSNSSSKKLMAYLREISLPDQ
ncbi:DUF615 domain-containing protein [Porticoccaceae bacterium]|nr:DUF615 domain-containing protein [Porticoccaceae bacterium]